MIKFYLTTIFLIISSNGVISNECSNYVSKVPCRNAQLTNKSSECCWFESSCVLNSAGAAGREAVGGNEACGKIETNSAAVGCETTNSPTKQEDCNKFSTDSDYCCFTKNLNNANICVFFNRNEDKMDPWELVSWNAFKERGSIDCKGSFNIVGNLGYLIILIYLLF